MSGQVLRVIPRQNFDFSYLAAAGDETRVLVGKIPSAQFTEGSLLVRIHNRDIDNSAQVTVQAAIDASTDEDPGNVFIDTANPLASVVIVSNTTVGSFSNQAMTSGALAGMVAIAVFAEQDNTTAGAVSVDISADLILKSS